MKSDNLKDCRVLIICVSDSWGGREQIALSDADELRKKGIPARIYCNEGSPIHERAMKLGIPCDYAPFFFRRIVDFILMRHLRQIIEKNRITLVHSHNSNLLGSLVLALRNHRGVPLFFSRHVHKKEAHQFFLSKWVMDRVDYFLTSSESLGENARLMYSVKARKIQIVPPGIRFRFTSKKNLLDEGGLRKVRERFSVESEETWIASRALFDPESALSTFIKAAAGILKLPKRVRFSLVFGPDQDPNAEIRGKLEKLLREFGIEEFFNFYTFTSERDYFELIQAVDIMVLPREEKGLGTSALKIMDAGTPLVLAGNDLAYELVGNGDRGQCFRPGHAYNLSQILIELMNNPSMREEMATKAQRFVHKNFDLRVRMETTTSLYERALKRRSPWREKFTPLEA